MRFRVSHTTAYSYSAPCSVSHTELHLTPHDGAVQKTLAHELLIEPRPDVSNTRTDYFGNRVTYFLIQEPHESLRITARSVLELEAPVSISPSLTPSWEQVRDVVRQHGTEETFDAFEFVLDSPRVPLGRVFAEARLVVLLGVGDLAGDSAGAVDETINIRRGGVLVDRQIRTVVTGAVDGPVVVLHRNLENRADLSGAGSTCQQSKKGRVQNTHALLKSHRYLP